MRTLRPSASRSLFRYSPIVAAVACAFAAHDAAGAIMVTNTNDSGAGSLRDAIVAANGGCFTDLNPVISFAIPGSGPFVIAPSSPLPQFNCGAGPYIPTIDATTQPGWSPNTLATGFDAVLPVELSG